MTRALRVSSHEMVEAARREITEIGPEEALAAAQRGEAVIVDIRDIRELEREGRIPGSVHCPRGMLEFWIDPESPYFKPTFEMCNGSKTHILRCLRCKR